MIGNKTKRGLILAAAAAFAGALACGARVFVVRADGNAASVGGTEYATAEEALSAWTEGTTLKLLSDVTTPTIFLDQTKTLDLNGFALKGDGSGSVLRVRGATLTVSDSSENQSGTITGGKSGSGAGIYVSGGGLNLTGGTVKGNTAGWEGGGVFLENGATFRMTGGVIEENTADYGGGVFLKESSAELSAGFIRNNTADFNGGGIYLFGAGADASVTLSGTTVSDNEAASLGGGISVYKRGSVTMAEGVIRGNRATGGAGIYLHGSSRAAGDADEYPATFTLQSGAIDGNTATFNGAGVLADANGSIRMTGGRISDNRSENDGGGIFVGSGGSAAFSGTANVTSNRGFGGTSNVFLAEEDLVSVDPALTGSLGFGMRSPATILDGSYTGTGAGITADAENSEIDVSGGALRLIHTGLVGIAISKSPTKTEYRVGENFDPAGMVVTAIYADGREVEITGYQILDGNNLTASSKTVTIVYTEGSTTVRTTVTIKMTGGEGENPGGSGGDPSDPSDGPGTDNDRGNIAMYWGYVAVISLSVLFVAILIVVGVTTHGFKRKKK